MSNTYHHDPVGGTTQAAETTGGDIYGGEQTTYHSTEGKKKFKYLYNQDTVSKAAGLPLVHIMSATGYPGGLAVDQPTTGSKNYFAGVTVETCTSGAWVWVQTWGYNSAAACRRYGSASNSNGLVGDTLTITNGVDALTTTAGTNSGYDLGPAAAWAMNANAIRLVAVASHGTSTTTSDCAVFIRGYMG